MSVIAAGKPKGVRPAAGRISAHGVVVPSSGAGAGTGSGSGAGSGAGACFCGLGFGSGCCCTGSGFTGRCGAGTALGRPLRGRGCRAAPGAPPRLALGLRLPDRLPLRCSHASPGPASPATARARSRRPEAGGAAGPCAGLAAAPVAAAVSRALAAVRLATPARAALAVVVARRRLLGGAARGAGRRGAGAPPAGGSGFSPAGVPSSATSSAGWKRSPRPRGAPARARAARHPRRRAPIDHQDDDGARERRPEAGGAESTGRPKPAGLSPLGTCPTVALGGRAQHVGADPRSAPLRRPARMAARCRCAVPSSGSEGTSRGGRPRRRRRTPCR